MWPSRQVQAHSHVQGEEKQGKNWAGAEPRAGPRTEVREEHFHFCFCCWAPDLQLVAEWVWEQGWASSSILRLSSAGRDESENGWKQGNKRFIIHPLPWQLSPARGTAEQPAGLASHGARAAPESRRVERAGNPSGMSRCSRCPPPAMAREDRTGTWPLFPLPPLFPRWPH